MGCNLGPQGTFLRCGHPIRSKEGIPGLHAVVTAMSPVSRTSCTRCYEEDAYAPIQRPFRYSLTTKSRIKSVYV